MVSGLPASGKTTLGAGLAARLSLPLLDKDHILEALFDTFGTIDVETRQRLSRTSDGVLAKLAEMSQGAVIVSFWRHEQVVGTSGTPTSWLKAMSPHIVEVYCDCPPRLAEQRFKSRQRHFGHNDGARFEQLQAQFERLSALGPLNIGALVRVSTDAGYNFDLVADQVRRHLKVRL